VDKTLNKIILAFVALIIFDTLTLDLNFSKQQFGVLNGLINTSRSVVAFVRAIN